MTEAGDRVILTEVRERMTQQFSVGDEASDDVVVDDNDESVVGRQQRMLSSCEWCTARFLDGCVCCCRHFE